MEDSSIGTLILLIGFFTFMHFWRKEQTYKTNEKIMENNAQVDNAICDILEEYTNKFDLNEKTAVRISDGDITYFVSKQALHILDVHQISKIKESKSILKPNEISEQLANVNLNSNRMEISNIIWFRKDGNIDTNAIVSGKGGGSSVGGAIVGGALLGGAGAVIGSRKEVQISTDLQTSDNRTVIIHYKDGNIGQDLIIKNDAIYNALVSIIPEKEISNYLKSINQSNNQVIKDDHHEKLRQLKGLYEEGLITETDYSKKKNEIINSL